MKNMIQLFTLMIILMMTRSVAADTAIVGDDDAPMRGIMETHNAIESSSLRISLDSTMHGFVEGKVCDFCETIKVNITPETRAFANDIEVPLEQATSRLGRFATVIYELKTNNVSAIRW